MTKDSHTPRKYAPKPQESLPQLKAELHRRGLSDAAITATLRKKKRRKPLEFAVVKKHHLLPMTSRVPAKPAKDPPPRQRLSEELCTVEFAAERLKVHPKTILRFLRKGKLKATRIGKSYRILRSDLEAFAGVKLPTEALQTASMTSIVDIPDVSPEAARKWSLTITGALNAKTNRSPPLRAEIIYEPDRAHLKIVVVGAPNDALNLLSLIRMWIGQ